MSSPPDSNARILALAEPIADGRAIDWAGIDVSAGDPAAQQVLDELRVLAALADVHRTPDLTTLLASGDEPTLPAGDPAPGEGWARSCSSRNWGTAPSARSTGRATRAWIAKWP